MSEAQAQAAETSTAANQGQQAPRSFLDMPDDELGNLDLGFLNTPVTSASQEEEEHGEDGEQQKAEDEEEESEEESTSEAAGNEESEQSQGQAAEAETPNTGTDPDGTEQAAAVDYKGEYEKLLAPFRANGKDMQITSVDDARALMQMGANYNKKMAALKPSLKVLKLLENNGLLDEGKLGYLIDLEKKNPQAIAKLIKDSGIDPLDLDTEKQSDYKPTQYTVDDRELALDEVLNEIKSTPSYNKTLDVVSNTWDRASKDVIADNPFVLKIINDHMQSGVYDVITAELERERMLGRLQGLSDIDAYRQVGDAIQARNGFAHLFQKQGQQVQTSQTIKTPAPKTEDPKLKEKKRAASPSKSAGPATSKKADFNPLALSDEEFAKLGNPKLM